MSITRQVRRNEVKEVQGNNKIRKAWRVQQSDRYSIGVYCDMLNQNRKVKTSTNKITPTQIFMV